MIEDSNPPMVLAMVVCEAVWQDPATRKWTLLGCFSGLTATAFPCVHPSICVFVSLTDGRGTPQVKLLLVDTNEEEEKEPILQVEMSIPFEDPRVVTEAVFAFNNVAFPAAGEYRFRLISGSTPLMERRIVVIGPSEGNENEQQERRT